MIMHLSCARDNAHHHIFPHIFQGACILYYNPSRDKYALCRKPGSGGNQQLLLGAWKRGWECQVQESCWVKLSMSVQAQTCPAPMHGLMGPDSPVSVHQTRLFSIIGHITAEPKAPGSTESIQLVEQRGWLCA